MKAQLISAVCCLCFFGATPGHSEVVSGNWLDPNFALCEGIGAHASGRVRATATVERHDSGVTITGLSVFTTHPVGHSASAKVKWKDVSGSWQSTSLVKPWYDVILSSDVKQHLVLPQVQTSASGAGAHESMQLLASSGAPIKLTLTLLFTTANGSCPTSFEQDWTL